MVCCDGGREVEEWAMRETVSERGDGEGELDANPRSEEEGKQVSSREEEQRTISFRSLFIQN